MIKLDPKKFYLGRNVWEWQPLPKTWFAVTYARSPTDLPVYILHFRGDESIVWDD